MTEQTAKRHFKLLTILVYLVFGLLPFFHLNSVLDIGLAPRFTLLSVLLLVGFLFIGLPKKFNQAEILLTVFYLWNLVTLLWARNFAEGIFECQRVYLALCSFIFLNAVLRNYNIEKHLFQAVLISNFVLLAIGYYQLSEVSELSVVGSYGIFSLQGHKNLFASFLFLCIPFLIMGYTDSKTSFWKYSFLLIIHLNISMLFFIKTRAVYAGMGITVLFILSMILLHLKKTAKIKPVLRIAGFGSLVLCFVFILHTLKPVDKKNANLSNEEMRAGSNNERLQLLIKTKELIKTNWAKGVGAGNWQVEFASNGISGIPNAELRNTTFQRPHNDFLWIWSETGIPGLFITLVFYGCVFFYAFKTIHNKEHSPIDKLITTILAGIFLGFLCISFFDFPKERIEHLLFLMALISLILKQSDIRSFTPPFNTSIIKILIITILTFNVVIGIAHIRGEYFTKKMYVCRVQGKWPLLIKYCDKAKSIFYSLDPTSIPLDWYRGVANFSLANNAGAITDFENAYRLNPWNFNILNNLASSYENDGRHDLAKKYYKEALRINPEFDEARLNLFVIFYNEKAFKTCLQLIRSCKHESERRNNYLQLIKQNKLKL